MRKAIVYAILIFQVLLIGSLIRNIQLAVHSRSRVVDLEARKQELVSQKDELEGELAYVQSDFYVEKVAREELQLTKPDETVVILPEGTIPTDKPTESTAHVELPNYLKWWRVITGEE